MIRRRRVSPMKRFIASFVYAVDRRLPGPRVGGHVVDPALDARERHRAGRLEVDGQTFELSNSKSARISWPVEGQGRPGGASLKIMVSKDFWQDISFGGQWGVMKLIAAAKVNKQNNSTFSAKWQINVQNMYMLNFDARIQVSSSDHPFTDPVFQQFNCPADLIVVSQDLGHGAKIDHGVRLAG